MVDRNSLHRSMEEPAAALADRAAKPGRGIVFL
jgi:hypothetical protein